MFLYFLIKGKITEACLFISLTSYFSADKDMPTQTHFVNLSEQFILPGSLFSGLKTKRNSQPILYSCPFHARCAFLFFECLQIIFSFVSGLFRYKPSAANPKTIIKIRSTFDL